MILQQHILGHTNGLVGWFFSMQQIDMIEVHDVCGEAETGPCLESDICTSPVLEAEICCEG